MIWIVLGLVAGAAAIVKGVSLLKSRPGTDSIERATEEILLEQFYRWDRDGVGATERAAQLQEMLKKKQLPSYIVAIGGDPEEVRTTVTARVENPNN